MLSEKGLSHIKSIVPREWGELHFFLTALTQAT